MNVPAVLDAVSGLSRRHENDTDVLGMFAPDRKIGPGRTASWIAPSYRESRAGRKPVWPVFGLLRSWTGQSPASSDGRFRSRAESSATHARSAGDFLRTNQARLVPGVRDS